MAFDDWHLRDDMKKKIDYSIYTQICSTRLAGLCKRFRRVAKVSASVLVSLLGEYYTHRILCLYPNTMRPQLAYDLSVTGIA